MCVAKVKGNENPTKAIKHCYNDHPITFTNGLSEKIDNDSSYIFLYILCRILTERNACPCIIKLMKWHGMAMHDNMRVCVYLLYYYAWSP